MQNHDKLIPALRLAATALEDDKVLYQQHLP